MSRIVRLFVCPRGKQFLKEIYHQFDYIIIDSSPVLAADDTTSLAPKIDATLLVIRLSYTSARLAKKALELLYSRQVNVPGVILNYVDTSLPGCVRIRGDRSTSSDQSDAVFLTMILSPV